MTNNTIKPDLTKQISELAHKINEHTFGISEQGADMTEVDQLIDNIVDKLADFKQQINFDQIQIHRLTASNKDLAKQNSRLRKINIHIEKLCRKILDSQTYSANVQERLANLEE